jgi:hypothetical protein
VTIRNGFFCCVLTAIAKNTTEKKYENVRWSSSSRKVSSYCRWSHDQRTSGSLQTFTYWF